MNLNEYQERARSFAVYRDGLYPFLGLAEEAGEVAGKIAKMKRGDHGEFAAVETTIYMNMNEDLEKELGDVLWMLANCAHEIGLTLDDIASCNLNKLEDRKNRDKIKGQGDDR